MLTAFLQYLGFVASWNASRCRNFTVSIIRKGTDFSAKMGPNMPSMRYLWEPPVDVPVLDHKLAHLACVVIVPLVVKNWRSFSRIELESLPKHVGSLAWSGGRNVVIVDQSDAPITFYHRAKYALGDALVAQSHAESDEFIHGFDISIPIGFSPGGLNSPQSLQPLLHKPPKHRRYWLSFRGAMSMERTADGIQRHSLLWLQAINRTDRGRVGVRDFHLTGSTIRLFRITLALHLLRTFLNHIPSRLTRSHPAPPPCGTGVHEVLRPVDRSHQAPLQGNVRRSRQAIRRK